MTGDPFRGVGKPGVDVPAIAQKLADELADAGCEVHYATTQVGDVGLETTTDHAKG